MTDFAVLIYFVVYISHVMACVWIFLGMQQPCTKKPGQDFDCDSTQLGDLLGDTPKNPSPPCNVNLCSLKECELSWIYKNGFNEQPLHSIYIFAFYWIFEVITTVGYGDYSGSTSEEYIFSIALEFMGLTFFSFLMGSINGIFNTSDNFDDLIEEKLDSLDMWIKKIEKSNKPFHIQPTLYNDIRKYVE